MAKLTNAVIENAKPKDKPYEIRDDTLKGFFVIVHPATSVHPRGRRTFSVRTYLRDLKKPCRTKLGEYGLITLDEARKKAREALVLADQGVSPTKEKRGEVAAAASVRTIEDAYKRYLAEYMNEDCSPTTANNIRSRFRKWILPLVGQIPINKIRRIDVTDMHAKIGKSAPGAADHAVRELSAMLSWCQGRGHRDPDLGNPCKHDRRGVTGVRAFGPQKTRDRVLTRSEIVCLFKYLGNCDARRQANQLTIHPDFVPLLKLMFYTGARLSEVHRLDHKDAIAMGHYLHWEQIDLPNNAIALGRTKEKKSKTIYLCKQAVDVLRPHWERKKAEGRLGQPVFECSNPKRTWMLRVRPQVGLAGTATQDAFTLHGFRHNFLTYAAEAGVPERIRKRLVGHAKSKDVTEGYTHISQAHMRRYAQKVGDALDTLDIEADDEV
jgi:integrase